MADDRTNPTDPTPWASAPMIFVVAPACPACGHEKYDRTRTSAGGDGSRTRKATCRRCHQRFKIIIEPVPDSGTATLPVS